MIRAELEPPLLDLLQCQDIFATGFARIEKLAGGCMRLVLFAEQGSEDGTKERIVVARIIMPTIVVPICVEQLLIALSDKIGPLM